MPKYRLTRPAFLHNVYYPRNAEIEWTGTPSLFWIGLDAEAKSKLAAEVTRIKKLNPETQDNGIGVVGEAAIPPSWTDPPVDPLQPTWPI